MSFNLAQIELTNLCNLNCPICFREFMVRSQGFMNWDTFIKSLNVCKEMGLKEVWLHNWGEPMLHPNIYEMVEYASRDFKVGFATNGTILSKINLLKLTYLDLSIHSQFQDIKDLIQTYHIANHLGIDCRFRVPVSNETEYKNMKEKLSVYKVRWQRVMVRSDKIRDFDCKAIDKVFVIYWDGLVVPCCAVVNGEVSYGDIFDENIINKINVGAQNIHTFLPDYCLKCFEVWDDMEVRYKL